MTKFLTILLVIFLIGSQYPYKNSKPTTKGISNYVEDQYLEIVEEIQTFIGDTIIDDYCIYTEDISKTNGDELGCFYIPNQIVISNQERYVDYELEFLSQWRKSSYTETNAFVRAVVIHEILHYYFYTQIKLMEYRGDSVNTDYLQNIRMFPSNAYSALFIEEGLCEYVVEALQEKISIERQWNISIQYLQAHKSDYEILYVYSSTYLQEFLDKQGVKEGLLIILRNPPPTDKELLDNQKYFQRLR